MHKLPVNLIDLTTLLYSLYRAEQMPNVGYQDSEYPLSKLLNRLNKTVEIDVKYIEKALYAANMLDEKEKFWHPREVSFDTFVKHLLPKGLSYDKDYCWIEGIENGKA